MLLAAAVASSGTTDTITAQTTASGTATTGWWTALWARRSIAANGPTAERFGVLGAWGAIESTELFDHLDLGVTGPRSPIPVSEVRGDFDAEEVPVSGGHRRGSINCPRQWTGYDSTEGTEANNSPSAAVFQASGRIEGSLDSFPKLGLGVERSTAVA